MILCRFFSLFHVFFSFVLQISARLFKVQVSGQSNETYRGLMDGRRFLNWVHLLKFATMMGMGKVMQSTCWTKNLAGKNSGNNILKLLYTSKKATDKKVGGFCVCLSVGVI